MDVVAGGAGVVVHAEQHLYARALMVFEHVVEHIVRGVEKGRRTEGEEGDVDIVGHAVAQGEPSQIARRGADEENQHPSHVERHNPSRQGKGHGGAAERDEEQAHGQGFV